MMHVRSLLTGFGVGAGLMYCLDPQQGRRRRKLAFDQVYSAQCNLNDAIGVSLRDLANRSYGTFAQLQSAFRLQNNSDSVVCDRVRSTLGRYVSHPGAIDVTANNGCVTLCGPVLASEVNDLVSAIASVRGVASVENRLDVRHEAENLSSLQGGRARTGQHPNPLEMNWAPGTRLLAGVIGCGLMANCLARRTPGAVLLGTFGFGLALRSIANTDLGRLFGTTGGRRARAARKTSPITTSGISTHGAAEQPPFAIEQTDPGLPGGGKGRKDVTPMTSVYPASGPLPPGDAKVQPMGTFGQGDRGPEGYYDSGSSEIIPPQRFAEEESEQKPT